jgi:hypothetical protein
MGIRAQCGATSSTFPLGTGHAAHNFSRAIAWPLVVPQKTVNEIHARGGSLNRPGPEIAGGMLFVESGYAANGMPGNVLLAFSIDRR